MKHLQQLLIALICLITFSCNEKPAEKLETIRIYDSKEVPAKELIDKVDFVKLETTADNIIGSVSKILFTDSLIIIVDKNKSQAVFVFDKNGRYLRKIGTFGGGPTEYGRISDVTLSFDKTQIHILSVCKVLTYGLDGKFVKAQKTKSMIIHFFECIDENNFATFCIFGFYYPQDKNRHMLEVTNNNFDKIIYKGLKPYYNENDFALRHPVPLINVRGKVFALPELSDTIFQVNNQEVTPRYYIESNKPKLSSNELVSSAKNRMSCPIDFAGGFYHIDDYIIINKMSSRTPLIFYNTKTKKTFSYNGYKLKDTHTFLIFTNTLKAQYKSSLVTVATPSYLIRTKDRFYKCYDKKMIDSLFENMTEDDNPVLLFYNVNKNGPK